MSRRRSNARSAEDMQRTIMELETKLKSESSRLKKKYESENQDLIIQIENLNRTNADLAKANKSLSSKLKVNSNLYVQKLKVNPKCLASCLPNFWTWSLLSLCFNLYMESTPFISSSASLWYQGWFLFLVFPNPYFLFVCRALDYAGCIVSFWAHVISYRIVS